MPVIALLHKLAPFADPVLCANCIARIYKSKGKPLQNPFKLTIDDMSFDELVELQQTAAELLLETLKSVSRPDDLGGGCMPELESGLNEDDGQQDEEEDGISTLFALFHQTFSTIAPIGFVVHIHTFDGQSFYYINTSTFIFFEIWNTIS